MADYTYLNNVPAARIHKSNAHSVKLECEDMLKYYRDRLMVLASSSPQIVDEGNDPIPWGVYVQREVDEIWAEMLQTSHRLFLAEYIIEYPDECEDELEAIVTEQITEQLGLRSLDDATDTEYGQDLGVCEKHDHLIVMSCWGPMCPECRLENAEKLKKVP